MKPTHQNGALAVYRPSLVFSLSLLTALSLSRLALVLLYRDRVQAVDGLAYVLAQGVRFDLLLCCALVLPAALAAGFLGHRRIPQLLVRVYLITAFTLALFLEIATPTFMAEYDLRPNILFVEYLKYPREVASMLLGGYKLPLVGGISLLGIVAWQFGRYLLALPQPAQRPRLLASIGLTLLILLGCALGIRSTLGHRPINPATVAFSMDLLVNDLCLNSLYSTSYAVYASGRHERRVEAYGHLPWPQVVAEVRADMGLPDTSFVSSELPTLHRRDWVRPAAKPRNLVIILQESLGAEFVGAMGGVPVTPQLDRLIKEGIWFENLYATGTRSVRGIEAVTTGFTPTPARSVVKLPGAQTGFFSIAELLGRQGYHTSFFYGGEAHFDNMRQFFVGNGFQEIIEQKDFNDPKFVGSWGVSDEDLFNRAHHAFVAAGDRPFFSLVFTSSNHSPFEFPDNTIELYEEPANTVNNAVKYADYAMGRFFQQAKASSYWDDTVFLVVADHNSRVRGANLVPIEHFHVPALLLGGSITPGIYSGIASQIDLLPTLLGMLGVSGEIPAIGRDLFRPGNSALAGRAIMQYNQTQAYMRGDDVVVLEMGKAPAQYRRANGALEPADRTDKALLQRALAISIWSARAYRDKLYSLPAPARDAGVAQAGASSASST